MRIAILTLPLHTNYGGILQAYALQTVLTRMGHQVEVLQAPPTFPRNPLLKPLIYGKRIAKKILKDWKTPIFIEQKRKKELPIIRQHTDQFIAENINLRKINSLHEISPNDYDAIIVGSDQIWRKPYFRWMWNSPMKDAYLEFTRGWDIKRIAYATSFGVDDLSEYIPDEIRQCASALQLFDSVSVREDSGVRLCREHFAVEARHVLDPTMLLSKEDYETLVNQSNVAESPGDMLCYILDPTEFKSKVISEISSEKGLTPFNVFAETDNTRLPLQQRVQPPVESWLRGFMDAKFIVTDSFHACVFSIIFGKPFIAIGNAGRGMSRFTSLLSQLSLENRLLPTESDLVNLPKIIHARPAVSIHDNIDQSLSLLTEALS